MAATCAVVASPAAARTFVGCRSPGRSPGRCAFVAGGEWRADAEVSADFLTRIAQWRKDAAQSAQAEAQQGLREVVLERERLDYLRSDLADIASELQATSDLHEQGAKLREVVRESAEAVAARAEVVVRTKQEFATAHESLRKELRQEDQMLRECRKSGDALYAEAEKLISKYRDHLALSITRAAPHTVRFAFTLLDQADPAREFSFTLGLADQQKLGQSYAVHDCSPSVPHLPKLVEQLNDRCMDSPWALARFVLNMRRLFEKLATNESEA